MALADPALLVHQPRFCEHKRVVDGTIGEWMVCGPASDRRVYKMRMLPRHARLVQPGAALTIRRPVGQNDVGRPEQATERPARLLPLRSGEHTSELQSLMRIAYAVFC